MNPLTNADLPTPALDDATVRAHTPDVPEARFTARWGAALAEGPMTLLRSFPAAWWSDLRAVDPSRVPAGRGVAFGDAHPRNFGFLAFDEGVRYAFNDLDDSGDVEVALDALRYFTALSLGDDRADVPSLVARWADGLSRGDADPTPALARAPSREAMREAALKRWVRADDLTEVTLAELDAARRALALKDATVRYEVVNVRRRVVVGGGSGGLDRYWILARERDGRQDVLELKETAPAGSESGRGAVVLPKRLQTVRKALWGGLTLAPYHRLELDGRRFLARSRGMRDAGDGVPVDVQVRIMAAVHRASAPAGAASELGAWVLGSTPTLAARWRSLYARSVAKT